MTNDLLEISDVRCEYDTDGTAIITVLKGDDVGIKFKYGKVWFEDEEAEQPVLQFQYETISGTPVDKALFEYRIAYLLQSLLLNSLEQGTITYTGGSDAVEPRIPEDIGSSVDIGDTFELGHAPGELRAKPGETAMSFLDRLAAQGQAAMQQK